MAKQKYYQTELYIASNDFKTKLENIKKYY